MYTGTHENLWQLGLESIYELETENGILASGRNEVYGCIFGRDSLITSLSLLRVYERSRNDYFLNLVRKILINIADLQGRKINIESGEEPGKCIHEYRPKDHEHLTSGPDAWYVYPDNEMRNYDTVDATPLLLMAFYEYYRVSGDLQFIEKNLSSIRLALDWINLYGDKNNDGFVDYHFNPERSYGGLKTQSWMDSAESIFYEDSVNKPAYPVAPVEVQAYVYVALYNWGRFFSSREPLYGNELKNRAEILKNKFNETFVIKRKSKNKTKIELGFALDGRGVLLDSPRSSMGHCLWAVVDSEDGGVESIVKKEYISSLVERLLASDLFVPQAGIRTLSKKSRHFDPGSYHNGSIWPHDTAILAEGLENYGLQGEAMNVRNSLISAYDYFNTPIELFGYYKGGFKEYKDERGQGACRKQAWSAASLLMLLLKHAQ